MAGQVSQDEDDDVIAQINIIPFVDITLVLLIIFLLTSNIISRASIPVDLPQAAHANQTVDKTLNVVVTLDGGILLDGRSISHAELHAAAEQAKRDDPAVRVVIAADRHVAYDAVVETIDIVKDAGIAAFALNIEHVASR